MATRSSMQHRAAAATGATQQLRRQCSVSSLGAGATGASGQVNCGTAHGIKHLLHHNGTRRDPPPLPCNLGGNYSPACP
eukprot:CAMPEP_0204388914 /NCGR_PEP_ID=MMETSP0469-20131031/59803_1 /ASSEMBLY_ACC=CAM_ASM_000384 /TAXON_ID=2969 /ORGANISM="Oxyrrhis marina" /LENGTH=78 /DNA_ID=CAMNT_0051382515 /DNA_START=163 /DNA_END=396 /DNA_ORIENTATION=+